MDVFLLNLMRSPTPAAGSIRPKVRVSCEVVEMPLTNRTAPKSPSRVIDHLYSLSKYHWFAPRMRPARYPREARP